MLKEIKHLLTHSAIYGTMNILAKGVGFIMIPIYTHYIPPADYGVYELLDLVVMVVGIFLGAGIVNAVARFYFLYDTEKERNNVVSSAIYCLCGILALCIPIVCFFAPELSILIFDTSQYSFLLRLVFISFAFNSILEIPLSYIRFVEKPILFASVSLARLSIQLGLNIYFVVYQHLGIIGIVYSGFIASMLFSLFLVFSLLARVGWTCKLHLAWEMIKFGSPLILSNIGMFIIHFADRFYLKKYTSLTDVGIYSLGYKMGFLITYLIGQPFGMVWNYWRYTLIEQEDGERMYGKIFLLFSSLLFFGWLGLSLFSRELITVMADPKYYEAYKVVPVVALAYVFRGIAEFFKGMFFIEKATAMMSGLTAGVALCALLLYTFLIPKWGISGAAYSTLLIFFLLSTIYYIIIEHIRNIDYNMKSVLNCFVGAQIFFFVGLKIGYLTNTFMSFFVKIIILLFYPLFSYWIVLSNEERKRVQGIIHIILNKGFVNRVNR